MRTSGGSGVGAPRSSTSRISKSGGRTRDPHPAGSLGTRHGLPRAPLLRQRERDLPRARDATGARRPPAHQRESRDVRSRPVRDVP
ncbi:MAG: hypothetical protein J07HQW2_03685 [Haloquadratum walsbyi J07HQW2]|uniref:Uncharacterized protein n=1 Tax=Haloquadratum walsbyi J07HQW2 TaxID=1238425 RepID=U1N2T7_9EURY|nr:MAG: hypothetical protein J07HQW2_03685 [Haloquadratum walsbyi J07HQW2]